MGNILNIYRRECSAYFNSSMAYIVVLCFLFALNAVYFLLFGFFAQERPDFRPFFENPFTFGVVTVIFIPAVTMRLWSEERKQGTIELLMTLPLKSWEVVLGKFLAAYTVVALMILLTFSVPVSISFVMNEMDWGAILAMYCGMLSIAAICVALGGFVSAFTDNQVVAVIVTIGASGALWIFGFPPFMATMDNYVLDGLGSVVGYFGTYFHFQSFARGIIGLSDLIYAASLAGLFILLNNVVVEGRKY